MNPSADRRPARRWSLAALCSVFVVAACATPLDRGREAWDEGQGEFILAEPYYKEAIEKDNAESEIAREELFEIHMQLAEINKKDHPKDAEAHYRAAMGLDPSNAEARTGLIRLLMNLYRYEEAFALANEGATSGQCPGCKRLLAVMLIQGGDQRSEAEDWPSAEASYAAAMDLLPDASVALGLARSQVAQGKVEPAVDAIKRAAEMIDQNDVEGRRRFLEIRRALVMAALEANKPALADAVLDVAPKGVSANDQLGLAIDVSMELTKAGKADEALSRMQALAQAAEAGRLQLSDEQRVDLLTRVTLVFGARANQRLAAGDAEGAAADLEEALKLIPEEPTAMLQKAIVFGSQGDIKAAREVMSQVNRRAPGYRSADSVLYAMEANQLVAAGKIGQAADLVGYGKKADGETPEIHIAAAQVLAATAFDDMLKGEQKELRKSGLVSYPKGKGNPVKAGEALAELDWAKKALDAQDKLFPFRDPAAAAKLDATKSAITAYYTYPVQHVPEPQTVLVLKNAGATELTVTVEKGRFFRKKKKIEGMGAFEVPLTSPGVVTFTYGDEETVSTFVAEPNTKVEISLPPGQ